jgi:hypothetical protein
MYLLDEMLLEVAEYLSDHEVHCIFEYLRRKRLIKYYKLKNFYDYKDFFLYLPTRALLTRMTMSLRTHPPVSRKPKYFPRTIREFKYVIEDIENLNERHIPIIPDDVICDFELYCENLDTDLSQLPKNTVKLEIGCRHSMKDLALKCNLKCLDIKCDNVKIDLNFLPPTLEDLTLCHCDNFNYPIASLPNNLKSLHMVYCPDMLSKIIFPPNLVDLSFNIHVADQYNKLPSGLTKLHLNDDDNLMSTNDLKHLTKLDELDIYTKCHVALPNNLAKLHCYGDFISNNSIPSSLEKLDVYVDDELKITNDKLAQLVNLKILHIQSPNKTTLPPNLTELKCYYQFYNESALHEANLLGDSIEFLHLITRSDVILNKLPKNIKRLKLSIREKINNSGAPQFVSFANFGTTIVEQIRKEIDKSNRLCDEYMKAHVKQDVLHYNSLQICNGIKNYFGDGTKYPKIIIANDVLDTLKKIQFDIHFTENEFEEC